MANRQAGNVIIVDSAMGNLIIMGTSQFSKYHVNAVAFWSADTTGRMQLSQQNTADVIVSFGWVGGGSGFAPATQSTQFGQNQPLEDLKIPVLTGGTAWLYLA